MKEGSPKSLGKVLLEGFCRFRGGVVVVSEEGSGNVDYVNYIDSEVAGAAPINFTCIWRY
jgi:hypothetical protein